MNLSKENEIILRKIAMKEFDFVDLMGISAALLYSRDFFNRNKDINLFLKEVYDIEFLPYVMRSRTLIVAKITRELNKKEENELKEIRTKIINYLNNTALQDDQTNPNEKTEKNKPSKKKDANEKLKAWLEGL